MEETIPLYTVYAVAKWLFSVIVTVRIVWRTSPPGKVKIILESTFEIRRYIIQWVASLPSKAFSMGVRSDCKMCCSGIKSFGIADWDLMIRSWCDEASALPNDRWVIVFIRHVMFTLALLWSEFGDIYYSYSDRHWDAYVVWGLYYYVFWKQETGISAHLCCGISL